MKTILIASLLGLAASPAFARYLQTTAGDGKVVVADSVTSLQWTYDYSSSLNWQEALAYCEGLSYGGHSDWRLPNVNELRSLINVSRVLPASDFPNAGMDTFWSSSSFVGFPSGPSTNYGWIAHAWYVNFGDGNVSILYFSKSSYLTVRCVRP